MRRRDYSTVGSNFAICYGIIGAVNYLSKNGRGGCARCVSHAQRLSQRGRALPGEQPGVRRSRIKGLNNALDLFLEHPELGFVWMAYDEKGVAGICVVCYAISTSMGSVVAKLDDVSVKPDRRGKGIGSEMLQPVEGAATKRSGDAHRRGGAPRKPRGAALLRKGRLRRAQRRAPLVFDLSFSHRLHRFRIADSLSVFICGYFRFAISSKYFANATIPPDACCQSKFSFGA